MAKKIAVDPLMDKLVSLCKRRGFVFQSSEIYGGLGSCWDYGPLGVELKNNIKRSWWEAMTHRRDDIEGLDAAILMHPQVWITSGHVEGFTDPLVDCKKCKHRFRSDQIEASTKADTIEDVVAGIKTGEPAEAMAFQLSKSKAVKVCPDCGGELTEPRMFNLMFKTFMGPVEDETAVVYMRPETAQGIYVNFLNVLQPSRQKVPFGIAQIGKAFRNEITPGNFIFRTREFEQMEMQFFVHPSEDQKWFDYWKEQRWNWYLEIGIRPEKLRWHEHEKGELAHYAKAAYDIEYEFSFGWKEIEGIHNRTDFDLSRHTKATGKDLSYFDQERNEKFIPYIIETSAGADRSTLVTLVDAYAEEEVKGENRVVLRLSPRIAPIKAAVFPLVNKEGMPEVADKIYHELKRHFKVFYDDGGAVGRRYRRMDEAGTPYCITVDGQTLQDETVTVRDRDTMEQTRHKIGELVGLVGERVSTQLLGAGQ